MAVKITVGAAYIKKFVDGLISPGKRSTSIGFGSR